MSQKKQVASVLACVFILIAGLFINGFVNADEFDEKIEALQEENAGHKKNVDRLADKASSYQDVINKLAAEIDNLRQAILRNQRESAELQRKIAAEEAELERQKHILGQNIKAMYLEGEISTLEMLASSKSLSDFVNKEQYRYAVQDKISTTVDKITELKLALEKKQRELDTRIKEQQKQQAQLNEQQAEQNQLLNYTADQKAAFESRIKKNRSKITELQRQQVMANAQLFGFGLIKTARCDIYPQNWCNAPMDTIIDNWGMYNRECVSWTAFRVAMSGRHMPYWGGVGNANQWDDNARAAGIPVDRKPRVGDVAISNAGFYGHAMYVEGVNGDGTIVVSQFNADWGGTWSMAKINVGNLVFIHFP